MIHYHPSNGYAFFYGDDDPDKRLEILDKVFSEYEYVDVARTRVPLQERFTEARSVRKGYPASDRLAKGMFTVNWLLAETSDANLNLALHVLEHILIGLPSSPLKKALMDSGLGDDLAGVGPRGGHAPDVLFPWGSRACIRPTRSRRNP